jgi:AAA domain
MTTPPTSGQGQAALPVKHLAGTDGAIDVRTTALRLGERLLEDVVGGAEVGLIVGRPGAGKSFIWISACSALGVTPVWWDPGVALTLKAVRRGLLDRFGVPYARDATGADLDDSLRERFAEFRGLLVVEEAKRLGALGLEELRYLHCQPKTQWSLLLVGSDLGTLLHRNPALDSRVARRVKVPRMSRKASIAFARAYHPLYAEATTDLLEVIEDEAKGVIRVWARTLEASIKLLARRIQNHLTREIVNAALGATRGLEL